MFPLLVLNRFWNPKKVRPLITHSTAEQGREAHMWKSVIIFGVPESWSGVPGLDLKLIQK